MDADARHWRTFARALARADDPSETELVGLLGEKPVHGFYRIYARPPSTSRWFRIERHFEPTEVSVVKRQAKGDFEGALPRHRVYVGRVAGMGREPRGINTHLHHAICMALHLVEYARAPNVFLMALALGSAPSCQHDAAQRRVRGITFADLSDPEVSSWFGRF